MAHTLLRCWLTLLLGVSLTPLWGCAQLLVAGTIFSGLEPTRDVPAEYAGLAGTRVCILVWADTDTRFSYPYLLLEVASHIERALVAHVRNISVVPVRDVVDYQNRDLDWDRKSPAQIGRRFAAERVLLVELSEYTTREPDSPHLHRGYISAAVKVYDVSRGEAPPVYRKEIRVVHPSQGPGAWGYDDNRMRREVMEVFAEELAGRFFDRKVKVK